MNVERILFILFFIFLCHTISAQKVFDTAFVYTPLNDFARKSSGMDSLSFSVAGNGTYRLRIFSGKYIQSPGNTSVAPQPENYDLNFEGDQYLLKKRWGDLPLPAAEIALLSKRTPRYFDLEGHWHGDSVRIWDICQCPNDAEEIFISIDRGIRFGSGKAKLKDILENATAEHNLAAKSIPGDSAYIFKVLIARDSSIISAEMIEGAYSSFAQLMMDELKRSGPWVPAQQDGRNVKAYARVFVRLKPKNRLIVDYSF